MTIGTVNGININYKVEGYGEPLVMISGLGSNQSVWMFQTCFFKKYFQVITFDNRGVGKSDKPKGHYSIRMMADDTIALMDCVGLREAHILGISMGGMIAQKIATNYPERTLKLVLGYTCASVDGALNDEIPDCDKILELIQQTKMKSMASLAFNQRLCEDGAYRDDFRAQAEACCRHQTLDRLSLIKSPTLVIVGTDDKVFNPTSSKVMVKSIPRAKLAKMKNGSHSLFIEMRRYFNKEVLNFLISR